MGAALRRWLLLALAVPALEAAAQERSPHALGEFEHRLTANGILLAAPHGTHDTYTPGILYRAALKLESGYLIARRFQADKRRINVNRPTEGAQLPCAQEARTDRAQAVYGLYLGLARLGYLVQEEGMTYLADIDPDNPLTPLQAASCTYRIARALCADASGCPR